MHEDTNQLAEIIDFFKEIVANETSCRPDEIDIKDNFHALGLDSINAVYVLEKLEIKYSISLPPLLFWDYPTIQLFSNHIQSLLQNA